MFTITRRLLPYFKGFCSSSELILLFVYMKCRFSLSYRDLEEMMHMTGVKIDHSTLQRWVIRFVPLIDQEVRKRKRPVGSSWRMDETYVKLNGKWIYLYRAVDRYGDTVDFFLSARRDKSSALSFFRKAIRDNNTPSKVVVDKSGSNKAALDALNTELDQDHRFIKKRIKPMLGFKSFHAGNITITGIENIRIIQKGQLIGSKKQASTFENFSKLMAS